MNTEFTAKNFTCFELYFESIFPFIYIEHSFVIDPLTSDKKEGNFKGGASYYILMND